MTVADLIARVEQRWDCSMTDSRAATTLAFGVGDSPEYPKEKHEDLLCRALLSEIVDQMAKGKVLRWKLADKIKLERYDADHELPRTVIRTRVVIE